MYAFFDALIPISICVFLPIAIVFLYYYPRINNDNKRTQIILKALETGNGIDADKLAETLSRQSGKEPGSPRKTLWRRLLMGSIFTLCGIAAVVIELIYTGAPYNMPWELGLMFLIFGALSLAIGVSFLLVYFVTRKQVKD